MGAPVLRSHPGRRDRRPATRARGVGIGTPPVPRRGPRRQPRLMGGDNLTILVALAAGVISFLSPCVLPLVPAYLGQLTAVAVAEAGAAGRRVAPGVAAPTPSRWTAFRHALAYVAGFGAVFT